MQSLLASFLLIIAAAIFRDREAKVHGVFMLGHVLNVWGYACLGLPLVEWAFGNRTEIRSWQQPAFLSYMAYGVYMTGRRPDLASAVLERAQAVLSLYPDPFYRILYVVSRLRSASQEGDIVASEAMAEELIAHSKRAGIQRFYYSAVADLTLCYAIRGLYWRADEQLKILASYEPGSGDPVERGSFYRLRGWAQYYCGRYDFALADAEMALESFNNSGSFQLARQMSKLLKILATMRIRLGADTRGQGSWGAIHVQIHLFRLGILKVLWGSNCHVKRAINEEIAILSRGFQRMVTVAHDRSAHISAIQDEMLSLADDVINAESDRAAWSRVEGVLRIHLKVQIEGIATVPGAPEFRTRGVASQGSRIEFAVARTQNGDPVTQVVSMSAVEGAVLSAAEDAIYTLHPSISSIFKIRDLHMELVRNAANSAIARMTQMLAHDVRKPFSILRMGLGMLSSARDPESVRSVLRRLMPEIDKAVGSVDGLIADVMEVGSTSTALIQEPASPESLIEAAIGEACRIYPKVSVSIAYDLQHTHMANVHVQKVGRVFSNILGNAIQAIGQRGAIWFKTREREGQIEFCLGNSGSCIPSETLCKLFDAFYTSGKKGGTGLGLAIAEKVVKAHGGRIWCESSRTDQHSEGKVEFFFTLPIADGQRSRTTATLPAHTSEVTTAILLLADSQTSEGSLDKGELTLEADIIQLSSELRRPLKVLVVDDEAVYRNALVSYFTRTRELAEAICVQQSTGSNAALASAKETPFDLIITDVDMGVESMDGFELVRALRQNGAMAMICVHSNRIVVADHKTAITSGADAFLPKPVARAQLLKLMLEAGKLRQQLEGQMSAEGSIPDLLLVKPEILVVDDNPFILEAWAEMLQGEASLHLISSLEDLRARLETDPGFADRLLLAVTDMHLGGSAGDGLDVGRLLKSYRPELLVLLSSDGVFGAEELHGTIDTTIGKDPVELSKLLVYGARA